MGKYKIKISYRTGDSFHNEDAEDYLELEWDNLDIAKENLKAIKDHYINVYQPLHEGYSYERHKNQKDIHSQSLNEFWYVNTWNDGKMDTYITGYCLKLKADNGNLMQMRAFWCGYFEYLYGAEIETDESDMKISI